MRYSSRVIAKAMSKRGGAAPIPEWKKSYEAALLEANDSKLPGRIREAQQAIMERLKELLKQGLARSAVTPKELQALYVALDTIADLQRLCEKCEDRSAVIRVPRR